MSDDRSFQNGFEKYENSLSAISTWKGPVGRRTHITQYRDLGAKARRLGVEEA